jgi:hypothetical protein
VLSPVHGTAVLLGRTDPETGWEADLPASWQEDLQPTGRLAWIAHEQDSEVIRHLASL